MSARSGLALLEAVRDGARPLAAAAHALGATLAEVSPGTVALLLPPRPEHANPYGIMHGGVIATVLDTAMGCAVLSTLPAGRSFTTLELKVTFHRGVPTRDAPCGATSGGAASRDAAPLRAEGRVLHAGRRVAAAEARLLDAAGRLLASATSTLMLLDPPPEPAPA